MLEINKVVVSVEPNLSTAGTLGAITIEQAILRARLLCLTQ